MLIVIRAVYGLPAKCVEDMGFVWAERRNNTHNSAIMGVFLQSSSLVIALSLSLFRVEQSIAFDGAIFYQIKDAIY